MPSENSRPSASESSSRQKRQRTVKSEGSPAASPPAPRRRRVTKISWDAVDKTMLERTGPAEERLWKRAHKIYNCIPPNFIPDGETVNVSKNGSFPGPSHPSGPKIKNINWAENFYEEFLVIIMYPCFEGNPEYVRRAISLAVYYRHTNNEVVSMPPIPGEDPPHSYDEQDLPEGLQFLKHLPEVYEGFNGRDLDQGVVIRDLRAITSAWECEHKEVMKKSKTNYRHQLGRPGTREEQVLRADVLEWKKDWILDSRPRGPPSLGGRAGGGAASALRDNDLGVDDAEAREGGRGEQALSDTPVPRGDESAHS